MKKRVLSVLTVLCMMTAVPGICSAADSSQIATADEMTTREDVVDESMVPVTGDQLHDGVYKIEVDSSSSMFRVMDCLLTVKDGEMTAVMGMKGTGYLKVYMGTGEEAVAAAEEAYIPFEESAEGQHTFTVPVEALDKGIDCAAFSKNREKWYERTLVFKSAQLPMDAWKELPMTVVESLSLEDGEYEIDVALEGGSGKTSVESPALLTVENGSAKAKIVFGSSNYDYVLVNGEKYPRINEEGNSTFEIPVEGFDWNMPIVADSVALGKPRELDYTLYFDSYTVEKAE